MIKLLNYKQGDNNVQCSFENSQSVIFYKFGQSVYSSTSDGISKESVKEVKKKLETEGLNANLDEFINVEFKEYRE